MPLPLAAIPLIASGLQAGIGAVQGIAGARKRKRTVRPEYSIPDEIQKNLKTAETQASYGLEGESKRLATEGSDRAMASAIYGAGTRRAGLAGMGGVVQAGSDAAKNLAEIDQIARSRKQSALMDARSQMAGYKDKSFEFNKVEPYRMAVDESQALIGSGLQNIMGGINTAAMTGIYGGGGAEKSVTPEQQDYMATLTPEQQKAFILNLTGKKYR